MYGVRDDYSPQFGRQVLSVWSGAFASELEATAVELPNHDGFMVRKAPYFREYKVRVTCPAPRTDDNYEEVDAAIAVAAAQVNAAYRLEYLRGELRAERISYGELYELQNLTQYIDPGDVELLEAAGVPEHN